MKRLYYRFGWLVHRCRRCHRFNRTVFFWRFRRFPGWYCVECALKLR